MSFAFLCPGQASQKVGMGYDLYKDTKIGKEYFNIANDVMNIDFQNILTSKYLPSSSAEKVSQIKT